MRGWTCECTPHDRTAAVPCPHLPRYLITMYWFTNVIPDTLHSRNRSLSLRSASNSCVLDAGRGRSCPNPSSGAGAAPAPPAQEILT